MMSIAAHQHVVEAVARVGGDEPDRRRPRTRPRTVASADTRASAAAPEEPAPHVLAEVVGAERAALEGRVFGCADERRGRSAGRSTAERRRSRPARPRARARCGCATARPRCAAAATGPACGGAASGRATSRCRRSRSLQRRPQPRGDEDRRDVGEQVERRRTRRRSASRAPARPGCRGCRRRRRSARADAGVVEHGLDDDHAAGEVGEVDRDHLERRGRARSAVRGA